MGRNKKSLIYLDTHIIIWLYSGLTEKLTANALEIIENGKLLISQIVRLELQYLYEIERIIKIPNQITTYLSQKIDLQESEISLKFIIDEGMKVTWTRDVFDRIIVAEAIANEAYLITADRKILKNFKNAIF